MNHILIKVNQKNKNIIKEEVDLRNFATSKSIVIDAIFYDESAEKDELGSRKKFLNFLQSLQQNDRLIISSIETLGWRVGELVQILSKIFTKQTEIVCAETNETIRHDMPADTLILKLAQTRKRNIKIGRSKLGRPKDSRSKSKYDKYLPQIIEFLKTNRNVSALARKLNISRSSLKDYIISRGL